MTLAEFLQFLRERGQDRLAMLVSEGEHYAAPPMGRWIPVALQRRIQTAAARLTRSTDDRARALYQRLLYEIEQIPRVRRPSHDEAGRWLPDRDSEAKRVDHTLLEADRLLSEIGIEAGRRRIAKHPVAIAVEPERVKATEWAKERAEKTCREIGEGLARFDGEINRYAPYPSNRDMWEADYKAKVARYHLIHKLTHKSPDPREGNVLNPAACNRFVLDAMAEASSSYDAFIEKLVGKIGDCDSATLDGSHVWGESLLTVRKGDKVEYWRTTQIVNRSVHGLE